MSFRLLLLLFSFLSVTISYGLPAKAESKLPEVVVSAERARDPDEKFGTYNQPRWTETRSFANSRVYVIPEDAVEAEVWITEKTDRNSKQKYYLFQKEVEFGLGHGIQIDFYQNEQKNMGTSNEELEGFQFELRWALAKWGAIFLNPTLYFEYHTIDAAPDRFEFRVLLGEDIAPNWRFTSNLFYESDLWGSDLERETGITAGLGRKITNPVMVSVEGKIEGSDVRGTRDHLSWEYYVGPGFRWSPLSRANVLLTYLIGTNNNAHRNETTLIFGYEF